MTRRPSEEPEDQVDQVDQDPEDADSGLVRERTELAWQRTGIAFAALGGAALKTAPVAGLVILAMSVAVFLLGRTSRPGRVAPGPWRRRSLLLVTVAVTAVSLGALALAIP